MKKLLALLVLPVIVLFATPVQADYWVFNEGQHCETRSNGQYDYQVCASFDVHFFHPPAYDDDGVVGHAESGGVHQARITMDFVKLYRRNGDGGYTLLETNGVNYTFTKFDAWSVNTPQHENMICADPNEAHAWVHSDVRYQLSWPNGDVGPWRLLHSQEIECYA